MVSLTLKKCKEGGSLEGNEIRTTIILTLAFQAVFTAFNALKNLHSSLHDENSLGMVCLSVIYGTGIVSSVLAPTFIGLVGAKLVLVFSFLSHCLYILANFYPSFAAMVPAAFILGLFEGPAWTSQSLYISSCAFSFSKSSSNTPYTVLSRFNVFFFAVFATTQIIGNLVTSLVIRDGISNQSHVHNFKFCGRDDCPNNENATEIEDPENWVIDITLGFYMACAVVGLCLVVFLLNSLPPSEWSRRQPVKDTATSAFNVLISTNMILLVPFIMFTAMEHALLLGAFTRAYVSCPIGIHMVGYVMAAYGGTTPLFLFIVTRLARVTGRFVLILVALGIHLALIVVLLDWVPTHADEAIIFIIPMIWGVAESILQAQANAMIAILFSDKKEPAFANFHAWRNVGYTITFLNVGYVCVSTKLVIAMICLLLGAVFYVLVEIKHKVQEKRALQQPQPQEQDLAIAADDPDHVEMRQMVTLGSVTMGSTASSLSIQDRMSFDRTEFSEIMDEAQKGWEREGDGLTLQLKKVMSKEHLRDSKVTAWMRDRPALSSITDSTMARLNSAGFLRSYSEGHLHSEPYKLSLINRLKENQRQSTGRDASVKDPQTHKSYNIERLSSSCKGHIPDIVVEHADENSNHVATSLGVDFDIEDFCGVDSDGDPRPGSPVSPGAFSENGDVGGRNTVFYINVSDDAGSPLGSPTSYESSYGSPQYPVEVQRGHLNRAYEVDADDEIKNSNKTNQLGRKQKQKKTGKLKYVSNRRKSRGSSTQSDDNANDDGQKSARPRSKVLRKLLTKKHGSSSDVRRPSLMQSLPKNLSLANMSVHNDDDDSDGFVDDDDMPDEEINVFADDEFDVYVSSKKKRKSVPKMESERVDCIY